MRTDKDQLPEGAEILRLQLSPKQIREMLQNGQAPADQFFDDHLSAEAKQVSSRYWTPISVTRRAMEWLSQTNARSVCDIGSGPGKFCVVGALSSPLRFFGVEQRPHLVRTAKELAKTFEVEAKVSFLQGVFGEVDVKGFDVYYFYNPFGENTFSPGERFDESVELSQHRFFRDLGVAERFLQDAPTGTYILTYNGYGGRMPAGYKRLQSDDSEPEMLQLWQKRHG